VAERLALPDVPIMITLFGATGYTGQLIARALDRARLPFRLAGRSSGKLAALSQSLPSHPPALVADVHAPDSLPTLFDGTRLLINCAGPFTDLGEPVVALAAARGVHYLDITNELAYVARVQKYDERARQTGAAIVPACGFEVALADCAAALMARETSDVIDEISIIYDLGGSGTSVGTRLSGLRTFATSWMKFQDGKLVRQAPGAELRQGTINGRPYAAIAFPSAETAILPVHCRLRNIGVWMVVGRRNARLIAAAMPVASWLLRTPLRWVAAQAVKRDAPPGEEARARSRFAIKIEMTCRGKTLARVVTGHDEYGLTAEIAAYAAGVITAPDYSKAGVLAPAQALVPDSFLQWLGRCADVAVNDEN
jgi:short subunit dehydrogenase-like uncharacterized protein